VYLSRRERGGGAWRILFSGAGAGGDMVMCVSGGHRNGDVGWGLHPPCCQELPCGRLSC